MKVVAIIQARLGSTRLPNKMLFSLKGKPLIEWVITRVKKSKLLNEVVLATSIEKNNDLLECEAKRLNCSIFRGSESDVLNRFYLAAKQNDATHVVRICADNPLISPIEIDNLIQFFLHNNCDYAYNHIPRNNLYPDGLGAEIITFQLLEKLENEVILKDEREHCFTHITRNPEKYNIKTFNPDRHGIAYPEIKLDIDTFDDFYKMSLIPFNENMNDVELIECFKKINHENTRNF